MSNLQQWVPLTDEILEKDEELINRNSRGQFRKLELGDNILRFLPSNIAGVSAFKVSHEHYVKVPGGKKKKFSCPRLHAKLKCPACEYADLLKRSGNHGDANEAREYSPQTSVYANVIDRLAPEKGPQILRLPVGVYDQLKAIAKNKRTGGDFTNPTEEGFDIIITRTGTGMNDTKYSTIPDRNNTALGNMDWIDQQSDLSSLVVVPDFEAFAVVMPGPAKELLGYGGSSSPRRSLSSTNGSPNEVESKAPRGRSAQTDVINAGYVDVTPDEEEDEILG